MIAAYEAFDVQLALARSTKLRVDTRQLTPHEVQYQIGYKWTLTLVEDEFNELSRDVDSDAVFRDTLDQLKPSCLAFNPYQSSR